MPDTLDDLLSQVKYKLRVKVKADIVAATRKYNSLIPKVGTLIHNDGSESKLVRLEGSVPMTFMGSQYFIPVELFIPEDYPSLPPKVYVRPTPDMQIAAAPGHVDNEGLVYLPYLNQWNANSANILNLCTDLSVAFSKRPPLYSRAARPSPSNSAVSSQVRSASTGNGGGGSATQAYASIQYNAATASAANASNSSGKYWEHASATQGYTSNTLNGSSSYEPTSHSAKSKREQLVDELTVSLQSVIAAVLTSSTKELDKEMELQYELESVAVNAVENNFNLLKEREQALKESIKTLRETKASELDKWVVSVGGSETGNSDPAAASVEDSTSPRVAADDEGPEKEEGDGDSANEAQKQDSVVDRLVYFDEVSEQLVKLVAEYNAIDDTIYHLDHALANGNGMDLQLFLKETRKLARKQFLCKTHILKINHKIGAAAGSL